MDWTLKPGEDIRRIELHEQYGGQQQGGISTSRQSPNILIFTDRSVGEQHGYLDRWEGTVLHYTGEGQTGNQEMVRGNRAIRDHLDDHRSLRVFEGAKGVVRYVGEFALDPRQPWYIGRAPATGGGALRNVIMFRLVPVGKFAYKERVVDPVDLKPTLTTAYRSESEEIAKATEPIVFEVDPNVADRGTKAHRRIQNELAEEARRHKLTPRSPGPGDPSFDVGWQDGDVFVVVEVKSITDANEVGQLRLGLGQVLDYVDLLKSAGRQAVAVLAVERQPSDRWVRLAAGHGVRVVWPGEFDRILSWSR